MFDKAELLKLATLLDAKATAAEAKADEFDKHSVTGLQDAAKEQLALAKSGRYFAQVCRDAHAELGKPRKTRGATKTRTAEESPAFTAFWEVYPRRVGKGEARRAWIAMRCDELLPGVIVTAVEAAKLSDQWRRDSGQFVPHPSTWLRGERWNDVHKTTVAAPPKASASINLQKWREFLAGIKREFEPWSGAMPYLKEDFTKWLRLNP